MKKIDGYKGIMELDLTDIHPVYHDIIIKQHKREIELYKEYQNKLPTELRYENSIGKIIKDKQFYDNIRNMQVQIKKKEEDEKFKLLLEKYY
jgi:hypothetical protein